jgi:hypothetical protein
MSKSDIAVLILGGVILVPCLIALLWELFSKKTNILPDYKNMPPPPKPKQKGL